MPEDHRTQPPTQAVDGELSRAVDDVERYVDFFENSAVPMHWVGPDGTVLRANEAELDALGYDRDEYVGSHIADFHADEEVIEDILDRLHADEELRDYEARMVCKDGSIRHVLIDSSVYRRDGDFVNTRCVTRDVTERKRLQSELRETIARLERSNERLRQFAHAASHDLKEPLRMVSSYLQLLQNRHEEDLDDEAREFIGFAVDGADRMRAMVEDLLTYARVKQTDEPFEPVDCEATVERVRRDLAVQIEESGADVVCHPLPTIRANENQIEQLFQNLVSNALKYSEDSPRIEIAAERDAGEWIFSVRDDGIGIDSENADRIFDVFERLHNEEYPGTGVGLSLCQEIVENHRGRIWVDSEPGEGATFSFAIPIRGPEDRV